MKRALTVALFSGLFVVAAPHVVLAAHFGEKSADHPAECGTPSERSAQHSDSPARSERSAPGPRYGDREQHDEDYF